MQLKVSILNLVLVNTVEVDLESSSRKLKTLVRKFGLVLRNLVRIFLIAILSLITLERRLLKIAFILKSKHQMV